VAVGEAVAMAEEAEVVVGLDLEREAEEEVGLDSDLERAADRVVLSGQNSVVAQALEVAQH